MAYRTPLLNRLIERVAPLGITEDQLLATLFELEKIDDEFQNLNLGAMITQILDVMGVRRDHVTRKLPLPGVFR